MPKAPNALPAGQATGGEGHLTSASADCARHAQKNSFTKVTWSSFDGMACTAVLTIIHASTSSIASGTVFILPSHIAGPTWTVAAPARSAADTISATSNAFARVTGIPTPIGHDTAFANAMASKVVCTPKPVPVISACVVSPWRVVESRILRRLNESNRVFVKRLAFVYTATLRPTASAKSHNSSKSVRNKGSPPVNCTDRTPRRAQLARIAPHSAVESSGPPKSGCSCQMP